MILKVSSRANPFIFTISKTDSFYFLAKSFLRETAVLPEVYLGPEWDHEISLKKSKL